MKDDEIKALNTELGKLGYVWQFITLASVKRESNMIDR